MMSCEINMSMLESKFFIAKADILKAYDALIDFMLAEGLDTYARKNLASELYHHDWSVDFNEAGDIDWIWFEGCFFRDYYREMFDSIAPFVEAGSRIIMLGEDNITWCWYFDGAHCLEEKAPLFVELHGEYIQIN